MQPKTVIIFLETGIRSGRQSGFIGQKLFGTRSGTRKALTRKKRLFCKQTEESQSSFEKDREEVSKELQSWNIYKFITLRFNFFR